MVVSVKPVEDGQIRMARVYYMNPGSHPHTWSPPKLDMRPIHKLAVIVPAGYCFEEVAEEGGPVRPDTGQDSSAVTGGEVPDEKT
jgi:hypothetical protein